MTCCIILQSSTDCFNVSIPPLCAHTGSPPLPSQLAHQPWADGFEKWPHRNVFLSESQRDKKWNPHFWKVCQVLTFPHTMTSLWSSTAYRFTSDSRQLSLQKLRPNTAADWLTFHYLLFLPEFCDSGLTFWPPTKTSTSQSSESYIQWLSHFSPSLFAARSFSPDGSWNESKLMNIITAS